MKVEIDVDYCIEQYSQGRSTQDIANELRCSWMTVNRRLKERGIEMRKCGPKQKYCPCLFFCLAEVGMSYYEIERLTGVNHSNVSKHLRKLGYCRGKGSGPKRMTVCESCGKPFETTQPNARYCGSRCKERAHGYDHIKRAKLYGVAWEKGITLDKLIKRDGTTCYICGKTCDRDDLSWGSYGPDYPTIDHVVPLREGGTHTWDNVRLACASCNCAVKRERLLDELGVA